MRNDPSDRETANDDGANQPKVTFNPADGSTNTTTVRKEPGGTTTAVERTVTRDGKTTVHTVVKFPSGKTIEQTQYPDGPSKQVTSGTDADGNNETTIEVVDKDKTTTTTTSDKDGHYPRPSYETTPEPDGTILIHWHLPNGTGGSRHFPEGTVIQPDASPNNPLPFTATPPPPDPPTSSPDDVSP